MPAKDLQKDLRQVKSSGLYEHLCEIRSGDIDDSICFSFPAAPKNTQIDLQAIVSREYLPALCVERGPTDGPQSRKTTPQATTSLCTPPRTMCLRQSQGPWRTSYLFSKA